MSFGGDHQLKMNITSKIEQALLVVCCPSVDSNSIHSKLMPVFVYQTVLYGNKQLKQLPDVPIQNVNDTFFLPKHVNNRALSVDAQSPRSFESKHSL